mmetsp:Transcript_12496/g.1869  ORF Transcript_12496/g.1869 Transcript_12496/m.1869 type:complete len:126 (+) Transcript_12496:505-882(+)
MLKILDFGTSEIRKKRIDLLEIVGTCGYMPPEVLKGKASYKSDIWSCGVIMCEMLTGKNPFQGRTEEDTFLNIYGKSVSFKSSVWEFISPQAKDLVNKMLHKNPKYRYNALDCINHYWFEFIDPL